ncbi:hypothetical protein [uncultured Ruminococcus sp.]|uniref:hypothetical protein n=1 Tax=uncultured Ruminococcus sp. TaxID=165186 RepID=UPI0025DE8040|nr:hypothetical protein [uncultured Ruminococcus sp.]
MDGRKEMISYYDLGGKNAEMYGKIDEFLELSRRYSPQAVKRKRQIGSVAFSVLTLASLGIMILSREFIFTLIMAAIFGWFAYYFIKIYGTKPFPDVVRTEKIIAADGLENVYDDIMHISRIADTSVYIGDRYLFKKGKVLLRINDIRRTYIRVESDDDGNSYYASVEAFDEAGIITMDLKTLSGLQKKRQQTFEMLTRPIEEKRYRLMKLEDRI